MIIFTISFVLISCKITTKLLTYISFFLITLSYLCYSQDDSTKVINFPPIQVYSDKETNQLDNIPSSVYSIASQDISNKQINNVRNLSISVPNLFVPDYGSKMSNAIYIRGIGSRNSFQSVGVYVDNAPIIDKAAYNFNFFDIQQIQVLRGSQNTLYGRNSMSGIINVYTLSPFDFQGTITEISGGNFGTYNAKLSHYHLFNDKSGIAVGAYYNRSDGYFLNTYTGNNACDYDNFGGRVKFSSLIGKTLVSQTIISFENSKQNAFPYAFFGSDTNDGSSFKVGEIQMNDESTYKQNTISVNQHFEKPYSNFIVASTTSFTNFYDDMVMDQDFTSANFFTLQQTQFRNSLTQEILLKSKPNNGNYQWTTGLFGFYDALKPNAVVLFKNEGISKLIESNVQANIPNYVSYDILDTNFRIDNTFSNPTYGIALLHQSSCSFNALTITAGLRLDYESRKLHYNAAAGLTQAYNVTMGGSKIGDTLPTALLISDENKKNDVQLLPKFALNYNFNTKFRTFVSGSRGFKSGGYNIQMLSDLAQNNLRYNMIEGLKSSITEQMLAAHAPQSVIDLITSKMPKYNEIDANSLGNMLQYNPEICWNFEFGLHSNLLDDKLTTAVSLYYMDITNLQLTQFSPNGFGRTLSNAGAAVSKGLEVSIFTNPMDDLVIGADYGFAYAIFTKYFDTLEINDEIIAVDYSNKRIPYAPQHTLSIFGQYQHHFNELLAVQLSVQYQGAGNIFWNEINDLSQKFYNITNIKFSLHYGSNAINSKGITLEFWANNVLNAEFQTFYFESLGNKFFQICRPATYGATIKIKL